MSGLQRSVEEGARPKAQHATTPPQQDPQTHTATIAIPTNPSKRKRPEWLDILLTTLQDQWFLVGIGVVITIASQVQVPEAQGIVDDLPQRLDHLLHHWLHA
jgi:hypothetical protein